MYGKKLPKNWSEYKYNIGNLRSDLQKLLDSDTITHKNVETIINPILKNIDSLNDSSLENVNQIFEMLAKKNLLSPPLCEDIINSCSSKRIFQYNKYPYAWISMLNFELKQESILALLKVGCWNLFHKINNSCILTQKDIDELFNFYYTRKNNHLDMLTAVLSSHPKLLTLMKKNNVSITEHNAISIINVDNDIEKIIKMLQDNEANLTTYVIIDSIIKKQEMRCTKMIDLLNFKFDVKAIIQLGYHCNQFNNPLNKWKNFYVTKENISINDMIQLLKVYHTYGENDIKKIDSLFDIENKHLLTPENEEFNEYMELICLYTLKKVDYTSIIKCDFDLLFMFAYTNKNIYLIELLLNNKYTPTINIFSYIMFKYFIAKDYELVKQIFTLLYKYGIQLTHKDFLVLGWIEFILNECGYTFPDDAKQQFTTFLYNNNITIDSAVSEFTKNFIPSSLIDPFVIQGLKSLLRLTYNTKSSENSIISNCMYNQDPLVFEYVHKKYNFVPSILDIMKITSLRVRIVHMIRFYYDLL
ncbi:hypothetical protein BMW23_0375 [Bodo saltans virus]|uniref:Uncharacterized protein n=1 Tax=Bodo saltans virus TaxID=2024608 RepID=A0A2H4UUB4_9VIRU|nr:hypothetical protein QJ851_gp0366 [Bodo saltans virus]ATZ80429.1 hypothetical protein BMW23_0375 [Bodo saltans virus]